VNPAEAVVRQSHFHQVVFGRVASINECHQLLHVLRYMNTLGRQMLGLRYRYALLPVGTRGGITFSFQIAYGQRMQLADELLGQWVARLKVFFDKCHGRFDIGHFQQLVGRLLWCAIEPAFHIVGQRGVVALDPGRS
jgi:hypothetical protein